MSYSQTASRDNFLRRADELRELTRNLAERHLQYLRSDLIFDVENFISEIEQEIIHNCLSYRGGSEVLQEEINSLGQQDFDLTS